MSFLSQFYANLRRFARDIIHIWLLSLLKFWVFMAIYETIQQQQIA